MKIARSKAAAVALVLAILASVEAPVVAGAHRMCAARHHGCATARLVRCCCPGAGERAPESAPATAKIELPHAISMSPVAIHVESPSARPARDPVRSSPPHLAAADRQSLFRAFLL